MNSTTIMLDLPNKWDKAGQLGIAFLGQNHVEIVIRQNAQTTAVIPKTTHLFNKIMGYFMEVSSAIMLLRIILQDKQGEKQ